MKRNKRDLDHYMSLPYAVAVQPLTADEGGGYEVYIPQLGRMTMTGAGDTLEEAMESLDDVKRTVFSMWIDKGFAIPEPDEDSSTDENHSGRILLRTSKEMHRTLIHAAEREGVSLNAYINQAIHLGYSLTRFEKEFEKLSLQRTV